MLPPIIRTSRLVLRPPKLEDAEAIFHSYAQDAEVCRYLTWSPHQTIAETKKYLQDCVEGFNSSRRLLWIIERGSDKTLIGAIELRINDYKADVGYVLARTEWGRGYMTEALKAVSDYAFSLPRIYRVWAVCDIENKASARVMEKTGMRREGILRRFIIHPNISDEPRDVYLYAMTR